MWLSVFPSDFKISVQTAHISAMFFTYCTHDYDYAAYIWVKMNNRNKISSIYMFTTYLIKHLIESK